MIVSSTVRLNRDGSVTPITRYTYFVGKHGPFSFDLKHDEDTPENVAAKMQMQVDKLTQLGVVK